MAFSGRPAFGADALSSDRLLFKGYCAQGLLRDPFSIGLRKRSRSGNDSIPSQDSSQGITRRRATAVNHRLRPQSVP